jgi:NAD(P)-dependent dehydrogenase (short-subunit alcohol dehydrogenase family)
MLNTFTDKVAVITGAASGFGLESTRIAAARKMKIVAVDVQKDALDRLVEELKEKNVDIMPRLVDVANADEMQSLADDVKSRWGAPHFVFNNAGVASGGLLWENSVSDWQWVLGVNLWGVIHGVRLFVPMMLEAAKNDSKYRGHIVNTASMAGLLTPPNMGIYNASKHAVVALTETLYQDLKLVTTQVGASVLCPYFVPTGISLSHRNRPDHLLEDKPTPSQVVSQTMSEKAVSNGKVSATDVALKVFEAIASDQFYIYSHPQALGNVQTRMQSILDSVNPPDPFAARPEIGEYLRDALKHT